MKIAVICSNGRVGKLVTKEAIERGLDVTAIARGKNESIASKFIEKDLFYLTKDDLKDFDVVVDAFGAWQEETLPLHSASLQKLCDLLSNTDTRILVVGGAGSLYIDKEHTTCLSEQPNFPDEFKPLATAMAKALNELRKRNDVKWTYISPAADFQAEGVRTGKYIIAGEEVKLNSKGESFISYADYAIAVVDEATKGNHIRERISVVAE